jgi:hypothetical protein
VVSVWRFSVPGLQLIDFLLVEVVPHFPSAVTDQFEEREQEPEVEMVGAAVPEIEGAAVPESEGAVEEDGVMPLVMRQVASDRCCSVTSLFCLAKSVQYCLIILSAVFIQCS